MSVSLSYSPMRVACRGHRELAGYLIRIGERAGDRRSLDSLHGPAFPMNDNLPAPQSAAILSRVFGSVIATVPSPRWRNLVTRRFEHSGPIVGARLLVTAFISRGQQLICNLRWPFKASSSLSFGSFVKGSAKPTNSVANAFFLAPVLSSVPVFHANRKAWSSQNEVQRKSVPSASGE